MQKNHFLDKHCNHYSHKTPSTPLLKKTTFSPRLSFWQGNSNFDHRNTPFNAHTDAYVSRASLFLKPEWIWQDKHVRPSDGCKTETDSMSSGAAVQQRVICIRASAASQMLFSPPPGGNCLLLSQIVRKQFPHFIVHPVLWGVCWLALDANKEPKRGYAVSASCALFATRIDEGELMCAFVGVAVEQLISQKQNAQSNAQDGTRCGTRFLQKAPGSNAASSGVVFLEASRHKLTCAVRGK